MAAPAHLTSMLLMGLVISASASAPRNRNVMVAVKEMRAANYFTFVTLLNMVQDRIQGNTTFLMPDDRLLSEISVTEDKVMEFLSRHSIPSQLLFDHLKLLPSGTFLPTNIQDYKLIISNKGRSDYYLNNVQLISPNICVSGSITCHGISGVLAGNRTSTCSCSHASSGAAEPSTPPPTLHSLQPPPPTENPPRSVAPPKPPPVVGSKGGTQVSGSCARLLPGKLLLTVTSCIILSLTRLQMLS